MKASEIRAAYDAGDSTFEILDKVIKAGNRYHIAVEKVAEALRLDEDEVSEMEDKFADCF